MKKTRIDYENIVIRNGKMGTVLTTFFVVMAMVPTLLRQFRRPLKLKKIITNAPRVLWFAE